MNRSTINHFKTAMLFLAPAAFGGAIGYVFAGWRGLALLAGLSMLFGGIVFFSADRIILKQHRAEYIPEDRAPELYALLTGLAGRAGVRRPALYLVPEAAPQMLVTGRSARHSAIGLSRGLLDLLRTEELAAMMAHTIHHLRSGETRAMTMAAGLAQAIRLLPAPFWPLAAALVRATVYGSRQFRADVASAHLIGDAHPLCAALIKMELRTPDVAPESASPATAHLFFCAPAATDPRLQLFRTHPPVAERLRRLEALGRSIEYFDRVMNLRPAND